MTRNSRRVVITGLGVISPLGNSAELLWQSLTAGRSGVDFLHRLPGDRLPTNIGAEVRDFTGSIEDFGELEKSLKRTIKKGLKLMCREIEMGVAAAQQALADANLHAGNYEPDRIGTMFGCDYIITEPNEFNAGIQHCIDNQQFHFTRWGDDGIPQVEPLWLLKYLPNMPASHVAIYNDLRGPSNSLTVREASANIAIAEATTILRRGIADTMVVGATGSRIHPLRSIHVALQEQLAACCDPNDAQSPTAACRPFDSRRSGMVMGEGAGAVVLESYETAVARGAKILGEVVGYGSSTVANRQFVADYQTAFSNVLHSALESASMKPNGIGHVHAHGLSTIRCDREESRAIRDVVGNETPVVAAKGNFGNLGAGSGMVELIASVKAMNAKHLFQTLNFDTADADCPIHVVADTDIPSGDCFVNLNTTPQGQASAVLIRCAS